MVLDITSGSRAALAGAVCLLATSLLGCASGPRLAVRGSTLQTRITTAYESPKSSHETITEAAWALRKAGLPAAFWAKIANSSRPGHVRQRTATLVLFADYLHKGMTLAELAKVMGDNKWLAAGQVRRCGGIAGAAWPAGLGPPRPTYMVVLGWNWPGQPTLASYRPAKDWSRKGLFGALPWRGTLCNRRPDAVLIAITGRRLPAAAVAAALEGKKCGASGARVMALGFVVDNCHDAVLVANDSRRLLPHGPSIGFGGRDGPRGRSRHGGKVRLRRVGVHLWQRTSGLKRRLIRIYRSRRSSPPSVAMAAWALRKANLPASFWAKIANSSRAGYVRQRTATLVLFADYLRKGMTLAQLAKVMEGNRWLELGDVGVDQFVAGVPAVSNGHRPVYWVAVGRSRPGAVLTSVVPPATQPASPGALDIPPGAYHYRPYWAFRDNVVFGTDGKWFSAREVFAALRGSASPASAAKITALTLGVSNSVDRLAVRRTFRKIFRNRPSVGERVGL